MMAVTRYQLKRISEAIAEYARVTGLCIEALDKLRARLENK